MRYFMRMMIALVMVIVFQALPTISMAGEHEKERTEDKVTGESNSGKIEEKEKAVKVGEVVVKARKIEERLSAELGEFGHPVEIITAEEIEDAGFVDVNRALEAMVPGFFSVTKSGLGDYNYASLHGSSEILWLLDGVRINNRLYGGGYVDSISVHNIERIEILKGGEGLFYGTGAEAGVINIITKGITSETSGQFGVSYGSEDYREVYGHATDTLYGHGLMAFGSYEGWDGYVVFNDEAYREALNGDKKPRAFDRTTMGVKYRKEFDLVGRSVLRAQLRKQQGKFDFARPTERNAVNDRTEEIGILKWDHDINEHFSYYIKSYLHRWWTDYTREKLDGTYVFNEAEWGYQDWGINFLTSTRWGSGHEILAGVDYQNYYGKDDVVKINGKSENVVGLFAQYRPYLPFSPETKLAFGGRYNISDSPNSAVWDVSTKTPLMGGTYFRGMVGTSFILPNAYQLFADDPDSGIGNPDLDPEKSLNVEAGIGGSWSNFRCEAGYFYQKVEDRIVYVGSTNTFDNADGNTKVNGVELQAGVGPFRGFSLDMSATWVDAENEDTGEQVERIPKFYAKANLRYRSSGGVLGADFMSRYTGDIYERGLNPFNDVKYGDYYVADFSCFVRFGDTQRHRLTLRVDNVFDEEYATLFSRASNDNGDRILYNYEGLPRTAIIGYSYTF
ncbi:TonB-dependent receptor [delta proteobacterium NaphS2]|nr:TonB-dependent receptor [delta proteobacterium NaphS2]